jgi:hypothetical protein
MSNRKKYGQFFTPKTLADKLVETTISRLEARNAMYKLDPRSLMDLIVLDPAVGSGELLMSWCTAVADRVYKAEQFRRDKLIGSTVYVKPHEQTGIVLDCLDGTVYVEDAGRELYQPMLIEYCDGDKNWLSARDVEIVAASKCEDDLSFSSRYVKILREVVRCCFGYDIDPQCVSHAKRNLASLAEVPLSYFDDKILCDDFLFLSEQYAYDVVLMNPPYLAGGKVSSVLGSRYQKQLKKEMEPYHGGSDLCAYFIQKAYECVDVYGGLISIMATNTISQGQTRRCGLKTLAENGCMIYNAQTNIQWPGDAKVTVSIVHLEKQKQVRK